LHHRLFDTNTDSLTPLPPDFGLTQTSPKGHIALFLDLEGEMTVLATQITYFDFSVPVMIHDPVGG
jgi:hypothetical protein